MRASKTRARGSALVVYARRRTGRLGGSPLSKELLGLANLRRRHPPADCVTNGRRGAGSTCGRETGPQVCRDVVLPNPFSFIIESAEARLCLAVALVRRAAVPHQGRADILRHAAAVFVHPGEVVLTTGIALLCGQSIPPYGFRVALENALSFFEQHAEIALRHGMTSPRGPLIPVSRLHDILREGQSSSVEHPEIELGAAMSLLSEGPEFTKGGHIVPAAIGFYARAKIGRRHREGNRYGEQRRAHHAGAPHVVQCM